MTACVPQPNMLALADLNRPGQCRSLSSDSPIPFTWIVPDEVDRRARLDQACDGAGPVVLQAAQRIGTDRGQLVVVSWNTYLGRGNLAELVDRLERGAFTGGARVERFTLLLQEVYRAPILAFARERSLHAVFAPTRRREGEAEERGAAILATSPIEAISIVELPFEKTRRIALGATVDGLQLVNVHFDTSVGILRGGPGAARRRQARALIDALAGLTPPLLVAGDLNTWWGDDEPAVKELRRAFPDAKPARARETWRGPLWTGNRLDYVFAKGFEPPITVVRLDERFGSDHWPLMATIPPTIP
jgi:endonuclease/exonuclease/phosphatase family metal-dependent hydrolase